jgi:hypothetical protein
VFRSTDRGASWISVGAGLPATDINALASLGDELFAGTYSSGVFRLKDGDPDWVPAHTGIPDGLLVTSLAVSGRAIFAGTSRGVFVTKDDGATWSSINQGLSDTLVVSLAVQGAYLVAGTSSNGIFLRRLSEVIDSVPDEPGNPPADFALLQNYPNPFNPWTIITFSVRQAAHIRIDVTDVLGREVAILVDERYVPGIYRLIFDGSAFASGAYFCTMRAGNVAQTRKLLLAR